ncbi:membrane protein [Bacteroidia bacterium]|nr:membrane protein [Bacteroidia bacterium]
MIGTIVNTVAIVAGSGIGLLFKKNFPEKYETIYFQAVGLFTVLLGVKMSLDVASPLLVVLSLILGGFAGVWLKLNEKVEHLGSFIKSRTKSKNDRFTEGLTTGFLLFCMGSMTIVGCIEEGLNGQTSDLLLTKSVMDFFSSIMLALALGIGVMFSAVLLFLFQGGITLLVSLLGKGIAPEIINEITVVGGIILIGLSFVLLKIKNIEIINFLPSLLLICLFVWLKLLLLSLGFTI